MKNNKFELTEETIQCNGHTLHRIKALKDFGSVHKGDIGGFGEKKRNLSEKGNGWIFNDAKVFDNAIVYDDALIGDGANVYDYAIICGEAQVFDYAKIYGNAKVYENAQLYRSAKVYGHARVFGNAEIFGNAKVNSIRDYMVFKNSWSSGRWFTWTRSNDMWKVGCFYGTGDELIEKAYKDSDESGRKYEIIVNAVKQISNEE